MPIQQHVLNWLYSILTSEYHDVNRCYDDVAQVLNRFPSLSPRTDVHTFPNGSSALLLHLSGTIPVNFRGNLYRFPLSIWVPHAYPREPPLIYVTPTENMMVRPGQHVDPQGQVYHPYLVGWAQFWDKSTLQDFLAILSEVFAKEPPVVTRQQSRPTETISRQVISPPPVPSLPPGTLGSQPNNNNIASAHAPDHTTRSPPPPPPPPKSPHDHGAQLQAARPNASNAESSIPSRYNHAPPLPFQHQTAPYQSSPSHQLHLHPQSQPSPHHPTGIPLQSGIQGQPLSSPQAIHTQILPNHNAKELPSYSQGQWTPVRQTAAGSNTTALSAPLHNDPYHRHISEYTASAEFQFPPSGQFRQSADLLLDDPLTIDIPPPSTVKAPPIPPNPEKDALLRQLAQVLAAMRRQTRQQNESSLAGLQAQRGAMLGSHSALQSETAQLTQLSNLLTSNTNILHEALHKADGVLDTSRSHTKPDIDQLLVAPTVVANQLYTLVAEERALGDAIFMLGRAMEKGRITPAVFAKMTRSLAREWYLKKALARKIGHGLGMIST